MAKHSVHISDKAEAIIGFLSGETFHGSKNYSGSINSGLILLDALMCQAKPELTEDQWSILYNTYAGCEIDFNMPVNLSQDVVDNLGICDAEEGSELAYLLQKLDSFSVCEQVAIKWCVKQFWQDGEYQKCDTK